MTAPLLLLSFLIPSSLLLLLWWCVRASNRAAPLCASSAGVGRPFNYPIKNTPRTAAVSTKFLFSFFFLWLLGDGVDLTRTCVVSGESCEVVVVV